MNFYLESLRALLHEKKGPTKVQTLILSGAPVPPAQIAALQAALPQLRIVR